MRKLHRSTQRAAGPQPEFLAALLEALPAAVLAYDSEGTPVMLNRRAWEIYGSPPALTDDMPLSRALDGEEIRGVELAGEERSGNRAVFRISGGPILDAHGTIQGAVLVTQEVTTRAAMDPRLRLRGAIANNAAEGIALIRASDGCILYVNPKWERMFGYAHDELVGRHMSVVTAATEEAPQARAQEIMDALEDDGLWSGEIHNLRKDGTSFWSAANVSRFDDPDYGSVWVAVETDITDQRAAADAHREAEQRFRSVFQDGPVGMALVGSDMRLADANRALCKLTGYRPEELVGKSLADITHPDDVALDAQLAARAFSGEIGRYRIEKRVVTKQDEVRSVAFTSSVLRDPDGRALCQVVVIEPLDEAEDMQAAEDQRGAG